MLSALDIARESDGIVLVTYQSSRNSKFDIPGGMFPAGIQRVGAIDRLVLAGKAELPSQEAMRSECRERRAGLTVMGVAFHSLMRKDRQHMDSILVWVNGDAVRLVYEAMKRAEAQWLKKYDEFIAEMKRYS